MAKELKIRITGDASGLQKATDDGVGILGGFSQKISAMSVAAGNLLADGLKAGFGAVKNFVGDSIGAASDMNETLGKVGVLFGGAAGDVEKFAAGAAGSLGQSKKQALDAAATFAVFGKSAGLGGKDLATFSTDLTALASDMASFGNTSPEEAIQAIGSALRGEAEPIRKYGVLLDDASLRQKALELGIISTTKDALTPAQKVLASQALIMAQTADAQGDFARTSGGLANQQRILAANVDNLKARIGTALLPTVLSITQVINQRVIPALSAWAEKYGPMVERTLQRLGGWVQKVVGLFRSGGLDSAGGEVAKKLGAAFVAIQVWVHGTMYPAVVRAWVRIGKAFGEWVQTTAIPYLQANLPVWLSALGAWLTGTALPWLGQQALALAGVLGGWIADAAGYLVQHLPGWLAALGDWLVGTALPWLGEQALALAGVLGGWIADAAKYLVDNLPGWLGSLTEWLVGTALPAIIIKGNEMALALAEWIVKAGLYLMINLPGWLLKLTGWLATDALPAITRWAGDAAIALGKAFLNATDWMSDVASSIVEGLIDGLWSLAGRLAGAVKSFIADNIPGPVRELLGINSPSKLFAGYGRSIAEGLALGMDRSVGLVASAAGGLAAAAVPGGFDTFGSTSSFQPLGGANGSGGLGDTYTFNITTAADPTAVVTAVKTYVRQNGGTPW